MKVQLTEGTTDAAATAPASAVNGITVVDDAKGRKISVRRLTALEKLRLKRLCGNDSNNSGYMLDVFAASSCAGIGAQEEAIPMTIRQVEALIAQLDDDGMEAIRRIMFVQMGLTEEEVATAKN